MSWRVPVATPDFGERETAAVLGDRRLVGWGVEPPSSVRLGRALEARGLEPGLIAGSTA